MCFLTNFGCRISLKLVHCWRNIGEKMYIDCKVEIESRKTEIDCRLHEIFVAYLYERKCQISTFKDALEKTESIDILKYIIECEKEVSALYIENGTEDTHLWQFLYNIWESLAVMWFILRVTAITLLWAAKLHAVFSGESNLGLLLLILLNGFLGVIIILYPRIVNVLNGLAT